MLNFTEKFEVKYFRQMKYRPSFSIFKSSQTSSLSIPRASILLHTLVPCTFLIYVYNLSEADIQMVGLDYQLLQNHTQLHRLLDDVLLAYHTTTQHSKALSATCAENSTGSGQINHKWTGHEAVRSTQSIRHLPGTDTGGWMGWLATHPAWFGNCILLSHMLNW